MKIAVISDTHITNNVQRIQAFIGQYLYDVDMIVHCGDLMDGGVLDALNTNKSFVGVHGNNDSSEIRNRLPIKRIIKTLNYNIGIFHGHGEEKTTIDRAYNMFLEDEVDIILFGHSHQPIIKTKNKILMINPGSLMDKRRERWFSYAILEVKENLIDASLKFITLL